MAQDLRTLNSTAGKEGETKRGFRPFSAISESLQGRRARLDAVSLLESAVRHGDQEAYGEAVGAFIALPAKQREKMLLEAQKLVAAASIRTFESPERTGEITALAIFFRDAAKMLPVDEEGEKLTGPYSDAIGAFIKVANAKRSSNGSRILQDTAALACTEALWALDYGGSQFWSERLSDYATRDFAIKSLLEMPETADFNDHGWSLLKKELGPLAVGIARSPSPQKADFLRLMLADSDPAVMEAAVKSVMFLMPAPDDIFKGVSDLKPVLERVGKALALQAVSSENEPARAAEAVDGLITLALNGITPYGGAEFRRMMSPLTGSPEGRKYLFALTGVILTNASRAKALRLRGKPLDGTEAAAPAEAQDDLEEAATEVESAAVNLCIGNLQYCDDRQFVAAMELTGLLASGRHYILRNGMMAYAMGEMVDVAFRPAGKSEGERSEQRKKALGVLAAMSALGLSVSLTPVVPGGAPDPEETARGEELRKMLEAAGVKVVMAPGPESG